MKDKEKIYTYESLMPFGMHRGKTIEYILEYYPDYIIWIDENTELVLEPEIVEDAQDEINK